MRRVPDSASFPRLARTARIIATCSPEFGVFALCANAASNSTTGWTSANDPVGIPFVFSDAAVVTHLGWANGSAAGGNHDIGIYTEDWVQLISTGSVAGSGNSSWQFVDVTDTPIPAGRYYLVKVVNATTANRVRGFSQSSLPLMTMAGLKESSTDSFPLANPLVGMTDPITVTRVPACAFAVRAPL